MMVATTTDLAMMDMEATHPTLETVDMEVDKVMEEAVAKLVMVEVVVDTMAIVAGAVDLVVEMETLVAAVVAVVAAATVTLAASITSHLQTLGQ